MVAIAALLVAVITLIPLFSIEDRVSAAKKEVEQRVYTQLEKNLELVPEAYDLLQKARESSSKDCFGDALYFAASAGDIWPRYKQEALRLIGGAIGKYLVLRGDTTYSSGRWDEHANIYFDIQPSKGGTFISHKSLAVKGIELLLDWRPESEDEAEKYESLAYLYGYVDAYSEMLHALKKATLNEEIKRAMSAPCSLRTLIRACGNDVRKIETVGQFLGISLPVDKQQFVIRLQREQWQNSRGDYLSWYALRKGFIPGTVGLERIQVFVKEANGKKSLYAGSTDLQRQRPLEAIADYEEISEGELFDRIDRKYFLITALDRE